MAQVPAIIVPNQPRSTYRSSNNAVFEAIASQHSGNTAPSNPYPFMEWMDTSTTPATKRVRNAANNGWIEVGRADTINYGLAPLNSPGLTGTPTAPNPAPGNSSTAIATTAFVEAPTFSWTNCTLQNSFALIAGDQAPQYMRSRGFVHLRGSCNRSGSGFVGSGNGTVIFNLPVGFRPTSRIYFSADSYSGGFGIVIVNADGNVSLAFPGTVPGTAYASLSGIYFAL